MATATAKKPVPVKSTVKPPAKPAATKVATPKAPKAPAAPKEVAPYEPGTIVTFKGYASEPPEGTDKVAEGTELAVVGQRVEAGQTFVACVLPQDYHRYMEAPDAPDAPDGNEFAPTEIKRTNKKVEEPFALIAVGAYEQYVTDTPDPLERGQKLYGQASEAFFYLGGTFSELWNGKAEDEVTPIFATYERSADAPAPEDATAITENGTYAASSQGFALFLEEQFPGLGGIRKAKELIGIYQTFSALPNAAKIVSDLPKIGWWKAGMLRSYVTEDNAEKLVEAATTHSVDSLRSHLKETYTTEAGTSSAGKQVNRVVIKKTDYRFQLFEDQGTGVTMIIDLAKKQLGITDDNVLFEHILTEWASQSLGPDAAAKAQAARDKRTEALVKAGVKLPESHPAYKPPVAAEAAPAAPAPQPARGKLPPRPKATVATGAAA